jgi:hypothetical protein
MPAAGPPGQAHSDEQIASLRGPEPRPIDRQTLRDIMVGFCAVVLIALSVTFFVTGANHNSTVNDLRQHGVRVQVKVTSCTGELGGSGSNNAGYTCRGSFTLLGKHYQSTLPDNTARKVGSTVVYVTPSDDPGHLTTVTAWQTDSPSAEVFIVPIVLGLVGLVIAVLLVRSILGRRRSAAA